jgi:hypothetical protein
MAMGTYDLNSEWKVFHFKPEQGIPVDYRVVFNIRRVDISPERINEREYVDEKEIQDGWGLCPGRTRKRKKRHAGNDIKTPHYIRIRAIVLEAYQTKAARLSGMLEVYDATRNVRLDAPRPRHRNPVRALRRHLPRRCPGAERSLASLYRQPPGAVSSG